MSLDEFKDFLNNSDKKVLVDFMAAWAPPCKVMNDRMKKLAEEYKEYCTVIRVDLDYSKEVHEAYGIIDLPTFKLFDKEYVI